MIAALAGTVLKGATQIIGNKQQANQQKRQAAMQAEQNKANLTLAMLQAKQQSQQQPKTNNQILIWVGVGLAIMLVIIVVLVLVLRGRNG